MFGFSKEEKFLKAITRGEVKTVQNLLVQHPELLHCEMEPLRYRHHLPLSLAILFKQTAVAEALINAGADINRLDEKGQGLNALHVAAWKGDLEILKLLKDRGVNKKIKSHIGPEAKNIAELNGHAVFASELFREEREEEQRQAAERERQETARRETERLERLKREEQTLLARRQGEWFLDTPKEVRLEKDTGGFHLTDVFNFETRERTSFWCKMKGAEPFSVERKSFDDFADKTPLELAFDQQKELGGTAERSSITANSRKKTPLPPGND